MSSGLGKLQGSMDGVDKLYKKSNILGMLIDIMIKFSQLINNVTLAIHWLKASICYAGARDSEVMKD